MLKCKHTVGTYTHQYYNLEYVNMLSLLKVLKSSSLLIGYLLNSEQTCA